MPDRTMQKVGEIGNKAGDYVDNASSTIGRSLESAADTLATRAESATSGLAKAGRYLQDADSRRMGRDITQLVKEHPAVSLAAGFGLGLLIGRAIAR